MQPKQTLAMFGVVLAHLMLGYASPMNELAQAPAPACSKDPCLKAVTSNRALGPSASPGCTSYFRVTVTPNPSTVRNSHTVTAHTSVVITKTESEPTSVTGTTTITNTQTVVSTTTITTTPGEKLDAREAERTSCPAPKTVPHTVPAWASTCTNTAVYSSACSCVNAPHLTKTKKACTVTSGGPQTITHTSTSTDYITKASKTITVSVSTITDTTTTTSSVTKTVTAEPTCTALPSSFELEMDGGIYDNVALSAGIFVGSQFPVFSPFVTFPQTIADLTLDSQGRLYATNTTQYVSLLKIGGGGTLFLVDTSLPIIAPQFTQPTFTTSNDPDCRSFQPTNGQKFAFCPIPYLDGIGLVLTSGLSILSPCSLVNVHAVSTT